MWLGLCQLVVVTVPCVTSLVWNAPSPECSSGLTWHTLQMPWGEGLSSESEALAHLIAWFPPDANSQHFVCFAHSGIVLTGASSEESYLSLAQ